MLDAILSWLGIYWYRFEYTGKLSPVHTLKIRAFYLEEARRGLPSNHYQLMETNDKCIV